MEKNHSKNDSTSSLKPKIITNSNPKLTPNPNDSKKPGIIFPPSSNQFFEVQNPSKFKPKVTKQTKKTSQTQQKPQISNQNLHHSTLISGNLQQNLELNHYTIDLTNSDGEGSSDNLNQFNFNSTFNPIFENGNMNTKWNPNYHNHPTPTPNSNSNSNLAQTQSNSYNPKFLDMSNIYLTILK